MRQLYFCCSSLLKFNWFFLLLLLFSGMAQAASYTFSGSSEPTCSNGSWSQSGSTWTCNGSFTLNSGDTIIPASSLTIFASGGMTFNGSNTVGSSSHTVNLQTSSGSVSISGTSTIYGSISGSGNITLSSTSVTGAVSTTGSINLTSGNITGNVSGSNGVTSTGGTIFGGSITATNGSVSVSGGSVAGNVNGGNGVTATNSTIFNGTLTSANGSVNVSGGSVAGNVSGNGVTSTNSTVFGGTISSPNNPVSLSGGSVAGNVSGNGVTTTNTSLSNGVTSNNSSLSITGGTIAGTITGNGITLSSATMTSGSISSPNNVISISNSSLGSVSSSVTISSNNVVNLTSSTTVYGTVTAGSWSAALNIDSTSKVYGVCTSNSTSTSSPSSYPRCSSIVVIAEYRMDELSWNGSAGEVVDSTGNGNNAAAVNGATTTQGKLCNAGNFNGSNQNLLLPNTSALNFGPGAGFTISTWIKTTDAYGGIVSLRNTGDGGQVVIDLSLGYNGAITAGGGQFVPLLRDNGGTIGYFTSGPVVNNGAWHFLAITFNPTTSTFTSYVDGSSAGSVSLSANAGFTSYGVRTVGNEGYWVFSNFTSTDNIYFSGQIDELKLFNSALSASTISTIYSNENAGKNWDGTSRICPNTGPNHYELSLPTTGIACLPTTVTVTACADSSSPCTNKYTAANGQTATLATSAGTLGSTSVTFASTGVATTTLSYPAATNGATATVTLSNESIAASSSQQCCPNGASCTVANSCSTTFNTAGLIFSASAATAASPSGTNSTITNQVAGTSSGRYYLQAVQTNTTTMACIAGLTGAQSVNFGYQCNNPATCYTSNLMSVNGGTATTVSRNNNGIVTSYMPVNLTFDSYGNAPFTFIYSDAGQISLFANATVNSNSISGISNAFVVKPYNFSVIPCATTTGGACLTAPSDPGLTGSGSIFAKTGSAFNATVTALTSSGTSTPSFGLGSNNGTESVLITNSIQAPTNGNDPLLGGTTSIPRSSFSNGSATITNLTWSEVGVITLTATNSTFIGNSLSTTGTSGNLGRFIPDHFETSVVQVSGVPLPCPTGLTCPGLYNGFVYSGQSFITNVAAKNSAGVTTQNYVGNFAKNVTLTAWDALGSTTTQNPPSAFPGSISNGGSILSASFYNGSTVSPGNPGVLTYTFGTSPTSPTNIYIRAGETSGGDGVTSLRSPATSSVEGGVLVASGRMKIANASGSQLLSLPISLTAQYWNGSNFITSSTDNNSVLASSNILLGTYSYHCSSQPCVYDNWTTSVATLTNGTAINGSWAATLSKPSGTFTGRGSVQVTSNSPTYLPSAKGLATFGTYTGNKNFIYMMENY